MIEIFEVGDGVTLKYDTETGHTEFHSKGGTLWRDWIERTRTYNLLIRSIRVAEGTVFLPEDSSHCFCGLEELETLDLNGFDTSRVINMNSMFYNCQSLTDLDLSGFDTSRATNMQDMFAGCVSLTHLDLKHFNTSNVIDMSWMFYRCSGLTSLDLSGFNTAKATDIRSMFEDCKRMTHLDLRSFDTSRVTSMTQMFANCRDMQRIIMNPAIHEEVDTYQMFHHCDAAIIWDADLESGTD